MVVLVTVKVVAAVADSVADVAVEEGKTEVGVVAEEVVEAASKISRQMEPPNPNLRSRSRLRTSQ